MSTADRKPDEASFGPLDALIVAFALALALGKALTALWALGGTPDATSAASTFDLAPYIALLIFMSIVLIAAASRRQLRAPFGLVLLPPRRMARATVLAVAAMWWAGTATLLVSWSLGEETSDGGWNALSPVDRFVLSLQAGVVEEATAISFPLGAAIVLTALGRAARARDARFLRNLPGWSTSASFVVVGLIFAALRIPGHLYQGNISALNSVVWGSMLLVIALIYRSVLPVICGHVIFDFAVAGNSLLPDDWTPYLVVAVLVPVAVYAATFLPLRISRRVPV